ncbi:MerR family DNA-binding protein [Epibacterium ulvae]|uniref:MerR family DNA-binding protein n=1 Tax=Epibacterium ulvae TaxID=1156985 RepID=UPI002493A578|nr:MerR family DNA-binding protein [Epibacterium ulvae]
MQIGELAAKTGVSRDTLRLYEQRGLIQSIRRPNGYRDFDPAVARLVLLIKQGQQLGFSLADMGTLIAARAGQGMTAAETAALFQQKITELDQKIAQMQHMRENLLSMMQQACPLQIVDHPGSTKAKDNRERGLRLL